MRSKTRWSPTLVSDGQKEKALAARSGMASLMSNTKWRKLFDALDRPDLKLGMCVVKFVGDEKTYEMNSPIGHCYGEKYFETIDVFPTPFAAIEWIEFPNMIFVQKGKAGVPPIREQQDADKARAILEENGRYPIEVTEGGFRVIGHTSKPVG